MTIVKEGDYISLDGSTGEVMLGEVKTDDRPSSPAISAPS